MAEQFDERGAERVDRLVADMLGEHHVKATPSDAVEHEAIRAAARLAGARKGYPRMTPAFRRRMARLLEKGEAPQWMSRRSALLGGFGLAAGATVGAFGARAAESALGRPGVAAHAAPTPYVESNASVSTAPVQREMLQPATGRGQWTDTGLTLADLADGAPRRVVAGAVGAFVQLKQGRLMGMMSQCTHLPCDLVWVPDRHVLQCPCHGLEYDTNGQALSPRLPMPALPLVNVRLNEEGHVEVLGT